MTSMQDASPYAVEVKSPAVVVFLWMIIVASLGAALVALIGAIGTLSIERLAAALAGIVFAILLLGFATVIESLVSIDAHIRALLPRMSPRV